MGAHTITVMFLRRRSARRTAALVLAVCSLAIPAGAAAYTSPNAVTGGADESSQPAGPGSGQSSLNAIVQPSDASSGPVALRSAHRVDPGSSLNAIVPSDAPAVVSSSSTDDGFDWSSAAVGAGAAAALLALGGTAFLTARRRTTISPASSS